MGVLRIEITEYFAAILRNKTPIQEFEAWLYQGEELLEESLGKETYFNLVNLNYKSKFILDDLEPILFKILDYKSYEDFKIRDILARMVNSEEEFISSCRQIYEKYCDGYSFLRMIALKFIIYDYDLQLDEHKKRKDFIQQYRQDLIDEGIRILRFLK